MEGAIIRPGFVSEFSCIGSDCEDSCCYDWGIHIDKQSYKQTCEHPQLKDKAKQVLKKTKKSDSNWATVKLNTNGGCPFLNENKLCQIHATAGEKLLSHTCKTYPRLNTIRDGDKYESLSLSCPEAVRNVLFKPNAFNFERIQSGSKQKANPTPAWASKGHDYSIQLLLNNKLTWEQSLLSIGILTNTVESSRISNSGTENIDAMFNQLTQLINNGTLQKQYDDFINNNIHQMHAFESIHLWLNTNRAARGQARFEIINEAIKSLAANKKITMDSINHAWCSIAKPALAKYPELFDRYQLYYMYNMNFPMVDKLSPSQAYRLMLLDSFMIRCYLAAMAAYKGDLSESDIVLCFQVYHTNRQHKLNFSTYVVDILEKSGFSDVASAISLLHCDHTPPTAH
ncbi:flagellin lysine-N-methylase [Shewanella eurypsychrophilus]|uniref:Flagellin lysine-N-methylase n=1 Tax=Shewanella eurypsychrophilus TaxID=2593656 RepID=A0ABX6VCI2_9GAMM|nr:MULTISPECIES: flagellin lysine-N-methylase [Shewanella]QFU25061.1 flagellar biosynthesis protein [Shewanella sp. YLB-09]QPG60236.1 flagellin lysine-N-methylase [Shewanella eurypsychrophilus]